MSEELTITRMFNAPREVVFKAWTEPARLASWFGPRGLRTPLERIEVDVRPGGRWQVWMVRGDSGDPGAEIHVGGEYREIVEPERLVFTCAMNFGDESIVTISLAEHGGKTEMTFHQTGLATAEERAGVHEGWASAFERLSDYFTDREQA
jgi:uncharacterized protein YndB with AHSA1/START domain